MPYNVDFFHPYIVINQKCAQKYINDTQTVQIQKVRLGTYATLRDVNCYVGCLLHFLLLFVAIVCCLCVFLSLFVCCPRSIAAFINLQRAFLPSYILKGNFSQHMLLHFSWNCCCIFFCNSFSSLFFLVLKVNFISNIHVIALICHPSNRI